MHEGQGAHPLSACKLPEILVACGAPSLLPNAVELPDASLTPSSPCATPRSASVSLARRTDWRSSICSALVG